MCFSMFIPSVVAKSVKREGFQVTFGRLTEQFASFFDNNNMISPLLIGLSQPPLISLMFNYGLFEPIDLLLPDLNLPCPEHLIQPHSTQEVPVLY